MGFVLDGLEGEAYDRSYSDRQLLGRIYRYFRPYLRQIVVVALLIVLAAGATALLPILTARAIDIVGGQELSGGEALRASGWIIAVILLSSGLAWLFNYFRQIFTARVVGDVILRIRLDAFDAVMARDMSFYDEFKSGRVVSRVTSDTHDFSNVVTLVLNLLSQLLIVAVVFVVLYSVNFRLALITTAVTPFIILAALAFRAVARRTSQQARRVLGEVNSSVQESITGIEVAKGFRQEAALHESFGKVNAESYRLGLRQGLVLQSIFPILGVISGIGSAIVVWFGGQAVLAGTVTPGEWFLFAEGLALFWFPLTSIASFWSQFQEGLAASERVFALMDAEPRVVQSGSAEPGRLQGRIEFRNVDFAYKEGEPVLRGFNLKVEPGETVALVGHTGAGKSSLGKLVARNYEFQGGQLLIDGLDIRGFDLPSYRRSLGVVQQTPYLFSGTIADNIRYGSHDVTDGQIMEAARAIADGDWLAALPQGLATVVGEGGRGISMGQRQLVALTRVLLQSPAIVILDEATASVDPLTEAQIQEGLDSVLQDRTALVIAHRLSTVRAADRIVVLDHGRVIEQGDHTELMGQGGHYARLYDTYFRHQSASYDPEA